MPVTNRPAGGHRRAAHHRFENMASPQAAPGEGGWPHSPFISHLPDDDHLLLEILAFCPPSAVLNAAATCVRFWGSCHSDPLWKEIYKRQYGWIVPGYRRPGSWFQRFASLNNADWWLGVVGGAIPQQHSLDAQSSSCLLSLSEGESWKPGPSLSSKRHALALAVDFEEDSVYAVGGRLSSDETLRCFLPVTARSTEGSSSGLWRGLGMVCGSLFRT